MEKNDTTPTASLHTLIEDTIVADSIKDLNDKLAAYKLTDKATIRIRAEVFAINREDIYSPKNLSDGILDQ